MSLYLQVISTVVLVDLHLEGLMMLLRGLMMLAVSLLEVLSAQSVSLVACWKKKKGTEMSLCQMHFVVILCSYQV